MREHLKDLDGYKDDRFEATSISASDSTNGEPVVNKTINNYVNELANYKELPIELYDEIQAIFCRYKWFQTVRHGQNVLVDGRQVSWHFNNDIFSGTPTICYYDGHEWQDDLYLDEIPYPVLVHILEGISKHPLRHDEQPNVTLRALRKASQPKIWLSYLPQKYHATVKDNGSRPA